MASCGGLAVWNSFPHNLYGVQVLAGDALCKVQNGDGNMGPKFAVTLTVRPPSGTVHELECMMEVGWPLPGRSGCAAYQKSQPVEWAKLSGCYWQRNCTALKSL